MQQWELVARERVRDTVAAYTHAGDRGRIEDLAACFTVDGVLEVKDAPPAVGRRAIVDFLQPPGTPDLSRERPSHGFVRHFVANLRFESVAQDRIQTAAYFAVMTARGPDHWGRYRDVFVPVGDSWLIAYRRATTDAMAPDSYARAARAGDS